MNEETAQQEYIEGTTPAAEAPAAAPAEKTTAELSGDIVSLRDLKKADYNPRDISEWGKDALRKSMMKFGDLGGIVVNVRTGRLVGGHQRVSVFDPSWRITKQSVVEDAVGTVAEGFVETPYGRWNYREVNWDEKTEVSANIAANKHGGKFNFAKMKKCVAMVDPDQLGLELMGLDAAEQVQYLPKDVAQQVQDENPTQRWAEAYERGEIKQVVLYFPGSEFNAVLEKLARIMKKSGTDNNTDAVSKALEFYENHLCDQKTA
jgi:hypothetical protein